MDPFIWPPYALDSSNTLFQAALPLCGFFSRPPEFKALIFHLGFAIFLLVGVSKGLQKGMAAASFMLQTAVLGSYNGKRNEGEQMSCCKSFILQNEQDVHGIHES